ncbi:MAG: pyridine nucleotide-disulfide oxidoreductase [Chloroflexota bacterium]|nr:MAG: pyridine nucleotide-disulfide oxidoreductase [Chloroflexota bacterium]
MAAQYDLVVVGAGSAGLAGAGFARKLGLKVALAESSRVGGDCTWTGCVPSKALLHAAETAHVGRAERRRLFLRRPETDIDFTAVRRTVDAARDRVYALETPEALARDGIELFLGPTAFLDAHTLEVGSRALTAKRFLICTGASPAVPAIPGLTDGTDLTSATVFDELTELPDRLVVLGGGPVGVELAQAFCRLGSRVTLIGRNRRVLAAADEEASTIILEALRSEGITVCIGSEVDRIERGVGSTIVKAGEQRLECDALLVAAGRRPNVAGLGLEHAGVEIGAMGISVDRNLRTTQSHIYAAGDVVGSFQFSHYAGWQAVMAVRNMFLPGSTPAMLSAVPWAVFTDPEVAQVGLTAREASERCLHHVIRRFPIARNDRAQIVGESRGMMKFVLRRNGTILGATIVGTAAAELINEISLAMDNRIPFDRLCRSMHVYPSHGFALQLASVDDFYEKLVSGATGSVLRALAGLAR